MNVQARLFTLLCDARDELRRGIHYLRWHHRDAEEIAPSFHSRRRSPTPLDWNTGQRQLSCQKAPSSGHLREEPSA